LRFEGGDEVGGAGGPAGIGVGAEVGELQVVIRLGKPGAPGGAGRRQGVEWSGCEQRVRTDLYMGRGTAPGILPRQIDQAGADGIAFDIFDRGPAVSNRTDYHTTVTCDLHGGHISCAHTQSPIPAVPPLALVSRRGGHASSSGNRSRYSVRSSSEKTPHPVCSPMRDMVRATRTTTRAKRGISAHLLGVLYHS